MTHEIKYDVIQTSSLNELTESIIRHLSDGYKLQGGVSTSVTGGNVWYFQAVVLDRMISIH